MEEEEKAAGELTQHQVRQVVRVVRGGEVGKGNGESVPLATN